MTNSGGNGVETSIKVPMVGFLHNSLIANDESCFNDNKEESNLSPEKLKEIANCDNLDQLVSLDMCLDSNKLFFGQFGLYVPNLRYLKLSNSIIPSIHDLGSSLINVEVLWMQRCCLQSIDGLEEMGALRELYFAFNEISDISSCGLLEYLEIIDLEGNRVLDKKNISVLLTCQRLTNLTLENNPIIKQFKSYSKYWNYIKCKMPNLIFLDNLSTNSSGILQTEYPQEYNFEENWKYINEVLEEANLGSILSNAQISQSNISDISPNSGSNSNDGIFTKSSFSKTLLEKIDDDSFMTKNYNSSVSTSSSSSLVEHLPKIDTGNSKLTSGGVICGDISKALRKRRNSIGSALMTKTDIEVPIETPDSITPSLAVSDSTRGKKSATSQENASLNRSIDPALTELDQTPADNERDKFTFSNNEIEAEFASVDALQHSCTEVLQELEAWRQEFLGSSKKKNIIRGIISPSLKSNSSQKCSVDPKLFSQRQSALVKPSIYTRNTSRSRLVASESNSKLDASFSDLGSKIENAKDPSLTKSFGDILTQSATELPASTRNFDETDSSQFSIDVDNPNLPDDLVKFKLRFRAQQAVSARQSELFQLSTAKSESGAKDMKSLQKSLIELINAQAACKKIETMDRNAIQPNLGEKKGTNLGSTRKMSIINANTSKFDVKVGQSATNESTITTIIPSTFTRPKLRLHSQQPLPSKPCIKQTNW